MTKQEAQLEFDRCKQLALNLGYKIKPYIYGDSAVTINSYYRKLNKYIFYNGYMENWMYAERLSWSLWNNRVSSDDLENMLIMEQ